MVPNLVVLIDLLDTRGYTDSQQASLNSILRHCFRFRSIVSHSSGGGCFLHVHSKAHRIFNEYKDKTTTWGFFHSVVCSFILVVEGPAFHALQCA